MKLLRQIYLLAAVGLTALFVLLPSSGISRTNYAPAFAEGFSSGWKMLLNFEFNTFHPWKFDPIYSLLPSQNWWQLWLLLLAIIYGTGFATSLRNSGSDIRGRVQGAVLSWLSLLWILGQDPVVLPFAATLPGLQAVFLYAAKSESKIISLVSAFAAACVFCLFAQQLAPLGVFVAAVASLFLLEAKARDQIINRIFWAALIPAIVYVVLAPAPVFPHYPLQARVVPDDGLSGMLRPLVGADSFIPITNWVALRSAVRSVTPAALFLVATCFFIAGGMPSRMIRRFKYFPTVLLALVLVDAWLPTWLSSIMPVQSIARLLPGGVFYFPLVLIGLALAVVYAFMVCSMSPKQIKPWILSVALMLGAALSTILGGSGPGDILRAGQIYDRTEETLYSQLVGHDLGDNRRKIEKLLSPSYAVYKLRGRSLLESEKRFKQRDFQAPGPVKVRFSSRGGAELAAAVTDGNPQTRWFAGGGRQTGKEWLLVDLGSARALDGIELSTGGFVTDYPRGIAVYTLDDCGVESSKVLSLAEAKSPVFEERDWQGPVLFSSEGLPYFGTQNYVKIVFPKTIESTCLLFRQTQRDSNYDWSVAELRLLSPSAEDAGVK